MIRQMNYTMDIPAIYGEGLKNIKYRTKDGNWYIMKHINHNKMQDNAKEN